MASDVEGEQGIELEVTEPLPSHTPLWTRINCVSRTIPSSRTTSIAESYPSLCSRSAIEFNLLFLPALSLASYVTAYIRILIYYTAVTKADIIFSDSGLVCLGLVLMSYGALLMISVYCVKALFEMSENTNPSKAIIKSWALVLLAQTLVFIPVFSVSMVMLSVLGTKQLGSRLKSQINT